MEPEDEAGETSHINDGHEPGPTNIELNPKPNHPPSGSAHKPTKEIKPWRDQLKNPMKAFSFIVALAAVAQGVVTFFQLQEMKTNSAQVDAAIVKLAEMAQASERPYVLPGQATLLPDGNVSLIFRNMGRGPALNLGTRINFHLSIGFQYDSKTFPESISLGADPIMGSSGALGPGDSGSTIIRHLGVMTMDRHRAVIAGSATIYLIGQFDYMDSAGNSYSPRFCGFYSPATGQIVTCPTNKFTGEAGHGYQPLHLQKN